MSAEFSPLYTAHATSTNGRAGRVKSDDATLDLPLSMPKGLGGDGAPGTNPEQLFAAGYSACFGSALGLVARMRKVQTGPVEITAHVTIGKSGEAFGLAVELEGHLPGVDLATARELMDAAHQVCPYSRATRGNVEVTLKVR
ncbi:MAG: organic hydroperoxide resistance protein [Myxococcales bacterium]|nr:organic hydroperoxide resistance protein [Myxococcales bacterium]